MESYGRLHVTQKDGQLFVDNDVRMRLKVERTKPYG